LGAQAKIEVRDCKEAAMNREQYCFVEVA
jgi:hypothetical protein